MLPDTAGDRGLGEPFVAITFRTERQSVNMCEHDIQIAYQAFLARNYHKRRISEVQRLQRSLLT
ncbi:hypothetical protein CA85_12110 [Allorhodopirellula solitaria]|uniref:Uncharacterized protein n=1 Tax=Allorhodopirellula solitaria TaxID=2527987 RepID=A0A5C5YH31_9BACT|nr:hypothetical protein CA85_12110 [Allorhodopirellula solitaria]